jgi:hypothetical protein
MIAVPCKPGGNPRTPGQNPAFMIAVDWESSAALIHRDHEIWQ